MDISKIITGQVVFRNAGITTPDGRVLKMFVGLVAMPKAEAQALQDGCQYTVSGSLSRSSLMLVPAVTLDVFPQTKVELSQQMRGQLLGDLLEEPIWRY